MYSLTFYDFKDILSQFIQVCVFLEVHYVIICVLLSRRQIVQSFVLSLGHHSRTIVGSKKKIRI